MRVKKNFWNQSSFFWNNKGQRAQSAIVHLQFHNCSIYTHHLKGHRKSFKMVLNSNLYDKNYWSCRNYSKPNLPKMSSKWWLSNYHKSKNTQRMELKFGVATILYKYSDLTKFDKNLEGSLFLFGWFEMEWPYCTENLSLLNHHSWASFLLNALQYIAEELRASQILCARHTVIKCAWCLYVCKQSLTFRSSFL